MTPIAPEHYGIKILYRDHKDSPIFKIAQKDFIKKIKDFSLKSWRMWGDPPSSFNALKDGELTPK
jgi:hypothetical protein